MKKTVALKMALGIGLLGAAVWSSVAGPAAAGATARAEAAEARATAADAAAVGPQASDGGAAALAAAGEAAAARRGAKGREAPEIGAQAPAFTLTGMDGKKISLRQFRGKPVLLNFWASWCGPCREEAPSLARLQQQYGDKLQIVAVNLTAADSEKSARQFAARYGFTFPVPMDTDGDAADRYRIRPIPTSLFIDADGVIRDGVLGALTWDNLVAHTERLLHPTG